MAYDFEAMRAEFKEGHMSVDPQDPNAVEDPLDHTRILMISSMFNAISSSQKVAEAKEKYQALLDGAHLQAIAVGMEGDGGRNSVMIFAVEPMPKSLGIRSIFEGVTVGFTVLEDYEGFIERNRSKTSSPSPYGRGPG